MQTEPILEKEKKEGFVLIFLKTPLFLWSASEWKMSFISSDVL